MVQNLKENQGSVVRISEKDLGEPQLNPAYLGELEPITHFLPDLPC